MAQVAGAIIVGMVVSTVVSELGPKLGLSESTSNMLGMAAGIYAGGMVGGGSTTAASTQAGATTSQVGTNIPAGYGGDASTMNAPMFTEGAATQTGQQAGATYAGGAGGEFTGAGVGDVNMAGPARAGYTAPTGSFQAPATGQPPVASPVESTVLDSGTPFTEAQGGTPPAEKPGMLSQDLGASTADDLAQTSTTQAGQMAAENTADRVIESTLTPERAATSVQEEDWLAQFFSPDKTMDLAIAGMQGYAEAGMRQEEREYAEEVARDNEKAWVRSSNMGHPGLLTMGRDYPSTR